MINTITISYWELLTTIVLPIILIMVANYYTIKQLKKESTELLLREKYSRKLNVLQACYKLMRYTTDTENESSVIVFEKNGKEVKYFFRMSNIDKFLEEIPNIFYGESVGLYLPSEIKEKLFEYRSIVFGLKLKEKNNNSDKIEFTNDDTRKRLVELHQGIINELREQLDISKLKSM